MMQEKLQHPAVCDNRSVGVIVYKGDEILLLERAKYPYGLACPAGHVDDHGSVEQAAVDEVYEETGVRLAIDGLQLVFENYRDTRPCRREGGEYHDWTLFRAYTEQPDLEPSQDETNGAGWYSKQAVKKLIEQSVTSGNEPVPQNLGGLLLEPAWVDLLQLSGDL